MKSEVRLKFCNCAILADFDCFTYGVKIHFVSEPRRNFIDKLLIPLLVLDELVVVLVCDVAFVSVAINQVLKHLGAQQILLVLLSAAHSLRCDYRVLFCLSQ